MLSESGGILRSSYSLFIFDVEARSLLASAFTQYKDIGQCGKRRILYILRFRSNEESFGFGQDTFIPLGKQ